MEKESNPDRGETSISKSVCATVNGSHRYEIKGFSLAKGMGTGKYIASDTFTVGGYQWAIYFYPDGKNPEDNSAHVSVFVALASEGTDVRALFELTLVDQSGKGKHKVHSHFDRALVSGPYMLKYRGSMWGYKRFYRRTALETSDYLKDDCIIMTCTVGVVRNHIETPSQLSIPAPPSDLGCCLDGLLKSGIGADVQFEVRDESFKAHKLILTARSPVFKAQFFGPIGNPDVNTIVVEDVEPLVFKAMLMFIYSDVVPDAHELTGSASMSLSTNMVQHLLSAADRYGLERLKILCEAKLSEQVTADTVASTMALAEQYQCHHLKSVCLKFTAVPENLRVVLKTEGFGHIEESCPALLSNLLETVAVVDNDLPGPPGRKRGGINNNISPNLLDGIDSSGRQVRRRQ